MKGGEPARHRASRPEIERIEHRHILHVKDEMMRSVHHAQYTKILCRIAGAPSTNQISPFFFHKEGHETRGADGPRAPEPLFPDRGLCGSDRRPNLDG